MTILNASEASANLYRLIDQTAEEHLPILITGKRNNAVPLCEEDWNSIQESLHLLSIPSMEQSIKEGLETPLSECCERPTW